MTRGRTYDPAEVGELAKAGRVITTRRVAQWLMNHQYDVKETVVDVLMSLGSARFLGTTILINGERADEYVVSLPDDDWYLKFWVDGEHLVVDVWSCCWDGAVH